MSDEIILSGSEETLKPIITLLIGINQMLKSQQGGQISTTKNSVKRKNKPQIVLYFNQEGFQGYPTAIEGEIRFRIMDRENTSLTEQEIKGLASIIKQKFATGGGFIWNKGKIMCCYTHWELGYQLQLLCSSENEAKRIIEQVLDIRKHSPNWEYLHITRNADPAKAFPEKPDKEIILGKSVRPPQRRPLAKVRFQYAYLVLHGLTEPIYLVDRSNRFLKVIERV